MRIALSALLASSLVASPAFAEDEGPSPLYLGQKNHFKVSADIGLSGNEDADFISVQPTVEGRFAIGNHLGVQLVVPMMYLSVSPDIGEGDSRFDLGNPTVAAEFILDDNARAIKLVRAGLAVPLLQFPDQVGLDNLGDVFMQAANIGIAAGAHGFFDLWRYAPETLSVFGEIQGSVDYDGVYMDFRAAAGFLIPTADEADMEIVLQGSARFGFGEVVIPFAGLGLVFIPTETNLGLSGEDDAFQFGVEAGAIFKLGEGRLDLALRLNIDEPAGFSFDDDGVFGIHVGGTYPF